MDTAANFPGCDKPMHSLNHRGFVMNRNTGMNAEQIIATMSGPREGVLASPMPAFRQENRKPL
jgi:hypothetical protein